MRDALGYPFRGGTPLRTFATGALLSALGVLVLPVIPVAGYYGRVLASSADGQRRPPTFARWRALFEQGGKTWRVVVVYIALTLGLAALLGLAAVVLGKLGIGAGAAVGLLAWAVVGVFVIGALFTPAWFYLPVAMTHVARADDVRAAFDVGTIGRVAVRREYLVAWLPGAALVLGGSIAYGVVADPGIFAAVLVGGSAAAMLGAGVTGPAVEAGLVGHAVGAAVNFYCQVVAFHLFGRGYGAAMDAMGTASADAETATDADEAQYTGWGAEAREWRERRREERERAGWEET